MEKLPVLVTGGAGYIGSHAVLALLDAGWPVAVIDDLSNGTRDIVPEGVAFYEGSVADRALVRRIFDEQGIRALSPALATAVVGGLNELMLEAAEAGHAARMGELAAAATELIRAVLARS